MKRVIHIISCQKGISGGEIVLLRWLNLINDYNIVISSGDENIFKLCLSKLIHNNFVSTIKPLKAFNRFIGIFTLPTKFIISIYKIVNINPKSDLYIANGLGALPYAVFSGLITRKPIIYIHYHPFFLKKSFRTYMLKILAFFCYRIICVSHAIMESLISVGISPKKCVCIYNGLDINEFDCIPVGYISDSRLEIGIVAAIEPWKGHEIICNAIRLLRSKSYDSTMIRLHIFGSPFPHSKEGNELNKTLKTWIRDNHLEDQILWHGRIDNIHMIYSMIDVLVNCSTSPEPLGTTIYEAMSAGKIACATNIGGNPEIITNNVDGFLFEPNNSCKLANLIEDIFKRRHSLCYIKSNAKLKVNSMFHINNTLNQYLFEIKNAIAS